jgi:hypothetical protein
VFVQQSARENSALKKVWMGAMIVALHHAHPDRFNP